MVYSVSGSSQSSDLTLMQELMKTKKSEDMFAKLSKELGSDGTTITKDQLESAIESKKEAGEPTGFLEDMLANFDKISTGSDSEGNAVITSSDLDTAMKNGTMPKPPEKPKMEEASATNSASTTSDTSSTSLTSSELTEDDLEDYYSELQQLGAGSSDIAVAIKNALSTGSTSSLTASAIEQAIREIKQQPQDVETITAKQLTSPIDLRV